MAVNSKLNRKTANGWETIHPETHADQVVGLDTALASITIGSLDDITDVNAPSPGNGEALIWNSTNSKWEPGTVSAASGDIEGVVAGTGLSGGGTSGTVTLNLDFSELTDIQTDVSGTTEMIVAVGATEGRKALSEIKLSVFNNDAGWTSNTGDILSVTAGNGLTGGGTSGGVTLNVGAGTGITVAADTVAVDTSVIATQAYVNTAVANLVDSSPAALDTLNELAAALGDDANFSTTVTNSIATKVSKSGDTMSGQLSITSPGTIGSTATLSNAGLLVDGSLGFDGNQILFDTSGYINATGSLVLGSGSGTGAALTIDTSNNIAVSGTIDGVDLAAFKTAYDSHNHNSSYLGISATAVNSDKVDGYHIVVGSTGTDANTLYFTT